VGYGEKKLGLGENFSTSTVMGKKAGMEGWFRNLGKRNSPPPSRNHEVGIFGSCPKEVVSPPDGGPEGGVTGQCHRKKGKIN